MPASAQDRTPPRLAHPGQAWLKQSHRMALVRQLCHRPGQSRVELARAVGLTQSTVGLLARELLDEGWLIERDCTGRPELGRRPTPLYLHPSQRLMLGVSIEDGEIRVALCTLAGELLGDEVMGQEVLGEDVLERDLSDRQQHRTDTAAVAALAGALQRQERALAPGQQVIGVGIGIEDGRALAAGVSARGSPEACSNASPQAMVARLREHMAGSVLAAAPVFVGEASEVMALGELEFGGLGAASTLHLVLGEQLTARMLAVDGAIDGRPPGPGAAGERGGAGRRLGAAAVGHMVLQLDGPSCACGRRGCALSLLGARAVRQHLQAVLGATRGPAAAAGVRSADPCGAQAWADALGRARQAAALAGGRAAAQAQSVVAQAGRDLGQLLQHLTALHDPACIVLGGPLPTLGEELMAPARSLLQEYAHATHRSAPLLRVSQLGARSLSLGAAAMVRRRLTLPAAADASQRVSPGDSRYSNA